MKAPEWVLNTLKNGYLIPFRTCPESYEERNNKSARDNMQIVKGIIADMIAKNIVYVVKKKPTCVNPLGLVSKSQDDGTIKHRLVLDVSRHVNRFIDVPHVRLSHMDKAIELTKEGDLQLIFDLISAYYHIKIDKDQHQFLGAAFQNSDGSTVYIQYAHLPFGLASAVHVITKMWKPLTRYLTSLGIRASIYIDDGRILARTVEEAQISGRRAYNAITRSGWAIEQVKSDKVSDASCEKKYLGFILNTTRMDVKAPTIKLEKIKSAILEVLKRNMMPARHLARVLGLIISLEPSHGMATRISTRSGYSLLAAHTESLGWKGSLAVTDGIKRELNFFLSSLESRNGMPMKSKAREIRLEMILKNPIAKKFSLPFHHPMNEIFISDASDTKVFVYNLENAEETVMESNFTEVQKNLASGARELLGLVFTLRQWKVQQVMYRSNIYWVTDSENMVSFINKGSRKAHIQDLVFEIAQLSSELGIRIEPIHVLRQDPRIEIADAGSKTEDTDNWSIDAWSFQTIINQTGMHFETDLFADCNNTRAERFFSLFYSEGTSGVDAFSQDWAKLGTLWLCPPVSALIRVHRRIVSTKCRGVLVLPEWETSSFLQFFMTNPATPNKPFSLLWKWRPYIIQNENAKNTALFGAIPFCFLALSFDTTMN